jgi:glycogen synthase
VDSLYILGAIERDNGWGETDQAATAPDQALHGPTTTTTTTTTSLVAVPGGQPLLFQDQQGKAAGSAAANAAGLRTSSSRSSMGADSEGGDFLLLGGTHHHGGQHGRQDSASSSTQLVPSLPGDSDTQAIQRPPSIVTAAAAGSGAPVTFSIQLGGAGLTISPASAQNAAAGIAGGSPRAPVSGGGVTPIASTAANLPQGNKAALAGLFGGSAAAVPKALAMTTSSAAAAQQQPLPPLPASTRESLATASPAGAGAGTGTGVAGAIVPASHYQPVFAPSTSSPDPAVAGTRAYAARPDANPHAVTDRHIPNRMLGGQLGFIQLVQAARSLGMKLLVQCDAAVSASRPHRKYKHLYARTLDVRGQAAVHAGTDSLENQWEDTQLLNYRKVESWDLLVSEMKTLVQNFGINGLYLNDCQSFPFIQALDVGELFRRDPDGEAHYTPREVLEGEVVVANAEVGYWSSKTAKTYANPLLVKLVRSLWSISPEFTVAGESHWGRAPALARSGVLPHTLDVISAMACTIGRYVDKNGTISSVSLPKDVGPVHVLKALLAGEEEGLLPPQAAPQFASTYLRGGGNASFPHPLQSLMVGPAGSMPKNGLSVTLRSLCSSRLPYPALLLGRSAWTGVDVMYSLPGVPMLFGREKEGKGYRVDITGTYQQNDRYLEEEAAKRDKRVKAEKHSRKYRTKAAAQHQSALQQQQQAAVAAARASRSASVVSGGQDGPASSTITSTTTTPHFGGSSGSGSGSGSGGVGGFRPSGNGSSAAVPPPISSLPPVHPPTLPLRALNSPAAPASGLTGMTNSPSFARLAEMVEDAHLGVGGVIPAQPVPASYGGGFPSYKLTKTGFSLIDLANMAPPSQSSSGSGPHIGSLGIEQEGAKGGSGNTQGGAFLLDDEQGGEEATSSASSPNNEQQPLVPTGAAASSIAQQYHPHPDLLHHRPSMHSAQFAQFSALSSGMTHVSSSPALQNLLMQGAVTLSEQPLQYYSQQPGQPMPSQGGAGYPEATLASGLEGADDNPYGISSPSPARPSTQLQTTQQQHQSGGGASSSEDEEDGEEGEGGEGQPYFDEEEDEEEDEAHEGEQEQHFHTSRQGGAAGQSGGAAAGAPGFGFHVGSKLFDARRSGASAGKRRGAAAGKGGASARGRPSRAGSSSAITLRQEAGAGRRGSRGPGGSATTDIARIQSWAALESLSIVVGHRQNLNNFGGGGAAVESYLQDLEARLRRDVGPEYGFDLQQIQSHYEHRRLVRLRYGILREGSLSILTARHRFGEHGHVLCFARSMPGLVAVVASNFNGHPSTFATDCSSIVSSFGASTAAEASASVAELMSSSQAVGEILSTKVQQALQVSGAAPAGAASGADGVTAITTTTSLPTLNLRGGVWEVRDIFNSVAVATQQQQQDIASIAGTTKQIASFNPANFNAEDGPLVGIVTSEEAAYAPMLTTLGPHRSYCWLYCASSAASAASTSSPMAGKTGELAAETDPAAMQWLFASSLLRLQSVLRLKECDLSSSVITTPEVHGNGGYGPLLNKRRAGENTWSNHGGGAKSGNEGWISPGEALKDEEIMAAARHNLVYSLLRHVVKRTYRSMLNARGLQTPPQAGISASGTAGAASASSSSSGPAGSSPTSSAASAIPKDKQKALVAEAASLLDAALRVLVTHLQLRRDEDALALNLVPNNGLNGLAPASAGRVGAAPSLVGLPLPSLHGAMNRGGKDESTASSSASNKVKDNDPAWFAIDANAAVIVIRAALFLAVKDVVAQASNTVPSSDVNDEDAALSALLVKALTAVGSGRTAAGTVTSVNTSASASSSTSTTPMARNRRSSAGGLFGVTSNQQQSQQLVTAGGAGGFTLPASVVDSLSTVQGGGGAGVNLLLARELAIMALAGKVVHSNNVSPIVFVTPELGKWSTVGGLGVMVDELSVGLAELGANVIVISPYYHLNRKGASDYLKQDKILYSGRNISVWVGDEKIEMGVHAGVVNGVRVFFLHNATVFPKPYPSHDAYGQTRVLAAFGKGCLELLCQWREIPGLIVTNDWFTGLVPAYARHGAFGNVFQKTDFMHIAHNLNPDYEGRLWPDRGQGTLYHLHGLPSHLLVDPHWSDVVINPTRAALLCTDTWATVSRSYRQDLLNSSPLAPILKLSPHPFAHPNGIPVKARLQRLASLPAPATHENAKAALQRKYFGFANPDDSIPLFGFVGRITLQKGVHLILQSIEEILHSTGHRAMFIVGGMASASDTYGNNCAGYMRELHRRYPDRFWANPDLFFTDGDLVNAGADFCMMPSMFEPGGIVQQEFFVAGCPVIAYKTGGLKDTVFEYDPVTKTGNGFTFEGYAQHDFVMACKRGIDIYSRKEEYQLLRRNARASVMDLDVVSKAWFREFYRLRRALPPPPTKLTEEIPVSFSIGVGDVPGLTADSTVEITGSFAAWSRKYPMVKNGDMFECVVPLPAGTYQYKFVVDGHWTSSPYEPTADDGTGNINNLIRVEPSPRAFDGDE